MTASAPLTLSPSCLHCGQDIPRYLKDASFCCAGCETVHHLLTASGLDRFYELKPARILPKLNYFSRLNDLEWVSSLPGADKGEVTLDVEGIQCAACVWVIRELTRQGGQGKVSVDTTLGRLRLQFVPGNFELKRFLERLQSFGYRTSPVRNGGKKRDLGFLMRLGLCTAMALNTVFLSVCLYLGLGFDDGPLFTMFVKLNYYQSLVAVAVGGSYFFKRAVLAVRQGLLHFDIPISIGILAAFLGSTFSYLQNQKQGLYFDSLTVFIALMLLGRFLQEEFLTRNRNVLLKEGELKDLTVTVREAGGVIHDIAFSKVKKGDHLLIQSGALLPVDSINRSAKEVECDLSSVTGEAAPILYSSGAMIPAGAVLIGQRAADVEALTDFDASLLSRLIPAQKEESSLPFVWQWVTKWYVILVLSAAFAGAGFWYWIDPSKSLAVFVGILVVTCPCSFGIAIPLARTMANKSFVTRGIFSRDGELPDKLLSVRKIFLDKTGTLTLAGMVLHNPQDLSRLSLAEREVVLDMVARSRHPASQAIFKHLTGAAANLDGTERVYRAIEVEEIPGRGLEAAVGGDVYRVGRFGGHEGPPQISDAYQVDITKNGKRLAQVFLREIVLDDAPEIIRSLRDKGLEIYQISGDKHSRVEEMGKKLGIPAANSFGGLTPSQKEQLVARFDCRDTLMLGDGLNDAAAMGRAWVSGAPVWERSVVAGRAGFFFVSGSLKWLAESFGIARRLKMAIGYNLGFTAVYNLGAVALAWGGLLSPLVCAILMPLSSLLSVGGTAAFMREGKWTS